ncbi:MAG: lysophospholipid acyltransferase family protein [Firmicutes bacterium]|nr:lysophospholipid acyltransferase family protein [Bacillota bacterium]
MYDFAVTSVRLLLKLIFRLQVFGQEQIPSNGPLILACNHSSNWDPVLVGCLTPQPVSFMAKEELFRFRPLGALLRSLHAFPIKRGASDRAALRLATTILEAGGTLVMFPEGTRKHQGSLEHLEKGVGFVALRSETLMTPVVIMGSYRPFARLQVSFGPPFNPVVILREQGLRPSIENVTEVIAQHMRDVKRGMNAC